MSQSKVNKTDSKKESAGKSAIPAAVIGQAAARLTKSSDTSAETRPAPKDAVLKEAPKPGPDEHDEGTLAARFQWLKPEENEPKAKSLLGQPPSDRAKVDQAVSEVKSNTGQPVSLKLQEQAKREPSTTSEVVGQTKAEIQDQLKNLSDAPPEEIEGVIHQYADVAHRGGEEASKTLASSLVDTVPLGAEGVYSGLTSAGLEGKPELATAVRDRLQELQNDSSLSEEARNAYGAQVADLNQVLAAPEVLKDVEAGLPQGAVEDLESAYNSAQKLNALSSQGPPGVAQAIADHLAAYTDPASDQDPRTLTPDQQRDYNQLVQSTILNLSEFSRNLEDPGLTDKVADSVVRSLQNGEYQGGWDEQFAYTVAQGGGAGLGLAVAAKLEAQNPGKSTNLISKIGFGEQVLQQRFANSAGVTDQLNADLAQIHLNFGAKFS